VVGIGVDVALVVVVARVVERAVVVVVGPPLPGEPPVHPARTRRRASRAARRM